MRILHFLPPDNDMIAQHVTMLTNGMGLEAENHVTSDAGNAKMLLQNGKYDILHIHGCWRNASKNLVGLTKKSLTRLVVTPHGQLQPWVQDDGYWKEKLPKRLLYQRDIIHQAYAIIVQGKMELECMEKLGWNSRCTIIRNAIITCSISAQEMARQTFALYSKVMDSNTLELLPAESRDTMRGIIKAGITGDSRWLSDDSRPTPLSDEDMRRVMCHAYQEQTTDWIKKGLKVLKWNDPDIDAATIDCFLPEGYHAPQSIQSTIGNQYASENERLMATFKLIRKLTSNNQLSMLHLCELDRELRFHPCEEEELKEELKEHKLWMLARRTMQLMADMTGLTEGYMPVTALDDRQTRQMRESVEKRLKIQ